MGALQPNGNWLPDTIIRSFSPATAPRHALASSGPALATPGVAPGSGGPPGPEVAATQIIGFGSAPPVSVPAARAPTVTSTSPCRLPWGGRDQPPPRRNQPRRRPGRPLVLGVRHRRPSCGIRIHLDLRQQGHAQRSRPVDGTGLFTDGTHLRQTHGLEQVGLSVSF